MTNMWKDIHEQPESMEKCYQNNISKITKLAQEIRNKNIRMIYIAARGSSEHAGIYAQHIMQLETGIPAAIALPSIFTIYGKSICLENTLVLGISQSGQAEDVIQVIKEANRQKAMTVSITSYPDSPLARESRCSLFCEADQAIPATKTFMTTMQILAWITAEWAQNQGLCLDLKTLPQKIRETVEINEDVSREIQRFRFLQECFILARGVNFAAAVESELKMQETTYIRARAYAISDFQHGPISMVEKGCPIFFLAPKGQSKPNAAEMIDRMIRRDADLAIISNDAQLLGKGTSAFRIPDTDNDMLSPFYNVTVMQMIACQIALLKGLDPDKPRGMNKIIITR